MIKIIYKLGLTCLILFTSYVVADEDNLPSKLIKAQLTKQSMELGMKSAILDDCLQAGHSESICHVEVALVDQIDLQSILEKVYLEVYTKTEMQGLYGFYSTELGGKYSRALLSMLAKDMSYKDNYLMPEFTQEEEDAIAEHLLSDLTRLEQNAQQKIQLSVTKHLTKAFAELRAFN